MQFLWSLVSIIVKLMKIYLLYLELWYKSFSKQNRMLLVLEVASFITCDTSTCYLSAFVLLLVSQVCTCQSSYFSVSSFYYSIF